MNARTQKLGANTRLVVAGIAFLSCSILAEPAFPQSKGAKKPAQKTMQKPPEKKTAQPQKIEATKDEGKKYYFKDQKEMESQMVDCARVSLFEDEWIYAGDTLTDIGFGGDDKETNRDFTDYKGVSQGKQKVAIYHIHPWDHDFNTWEGLVSPKDIAGATDLKAAFKHQGIDAELEYRVVNRFGVCSLVINDTLMKLRGVKGIGLSKYLDGYRPLMNKHFNRNVGKMPLGRCFIKSEIDAYREIGVKLTFEEIGTWAGEDLQKLNMKIREQEKKR